MNERLKQLKKQAMVKEYSHDCWGKTETYEVLDPEKFAELIVRECLDVVALRLYLGTEEICRQECKALASEIKEYFGVEA